MTFEWKSSQRVWHPSTCLQMGGVLWMEILREGFEEDIEIWLHLNMILNNGVKD